EDANENAEEQQRVAVNAEELYGRQVGELKTRFPTSGLFRRMGEQGGGAEQQQSRRRKNAMQHTTAHRAGSLEKDTHEGSSRTLRSLRGNSSGQSSGGGPYNRKTTHHSALTRSAVNRNRITSTSVRESVSPVSGETPVTQTGRELFRPRTQHLLTRSGPGPPRHPTMHRAADGGNSDL